jgi:hypothetical protein
MSLMNDADKVKCYEHWLKCIAGQDVESYTPERAKQQLIQIVGISGGVLRDPSLMDPTEMKKRKEAAMAAYARGDYMTGEQLKKRLTQCCADPMLSVLQETDDGIVYQCSSCLQQVI